MRNPLKKNETKAVKAKSLSAKPTVIDNKEIDDLVAWVYKLVDEAKKVRDTDVADFGSSFCELMQEYEHWDIGKHWQETDCEDPDDPDLRKENRSQQALDVIISIALANRPKIAIAPEAGSAVEECDALQQINDAEFDEMKFDKHLKAFARNSLKFGASMLKLHHTFLENEPRGKDVLYFCDPLSILWIGGAELDGEYRIKALIEVRERLKSEIEREYEVENLESGDERDIREFSLSTYMNPETPRESVFDRAIEYIVWLDDTTTERKHPQKETMVIDEFGEIKLDEEGLPLTRWVEDEEIIEEVRKYPEWRRIVVCGQTILYDGGNPYTKEKQGHGLLPYAKLAHRPRDGHFYGESEFEVIKDQQKEVNISLSRTSVNAALTANNQKLIDESALKKGFTADDITNKPALKILTAPGMLDKAIKNVEQTPISPQSMVQYTNSVKAIEDLTGAVEIARAVASKSESGIKVQTMDAKAVRRQGPLIAAIETEVKKIAILEIGNLFQFKGEEELYTISVDDPQVPQIAKRWGDIKGANLKYKVKIGLKSSMFSDRQAQFQTLLTLRKYLPELPVSLILKYADMPELYEEYKKFEERQRQMGMQGQMGPQQLPGQGSGEGLPPELASYGTGGMPPGGM